MLQWLRALVLCLALLAVAPAAYAGIDINTATEAELDTLPGIGPAKAKAIVDHRAQNGPFTTLESIQDVSGIGPATFANIAGLISLGGDGAPAPPPAPAPADPPEDPAAAPDATPEGPSTRQVDINSAGEAELQTLPGIGPSKAAAIVADRTEKGPFGSCQDLSRVAGIGPATVANIGGLCATE